MKWTEQAACLQSDADFFPENGNGMPAIRVCRTCPVRLECLDDAMNTEPDEYGIRGGLTATDRDRLRRERDSNVISFLDEMVPIIEMVASVM